MLLLLLLQSYAENGDSNAKREADHDAHGVSIWQAWAIPGVSSFSFCLFFSKLIAYTFLYWLPYYIKSTPIQGRLLSAKQAGDLSTLFDVGGVAGGIMAGHLSDKSGCSAVVATAFTIASVPILYMYRYYGAVSFGLNVTLMMLAGFFVNGPYALITTAVSADLGTHESLAGNAKALATVTAIIDGMGSIGAAIGPMLTGYISERGGFDGVFLMLYLSALTAGLLLIKLCIKEVGVCSGATGLMDSTVQLRSFQIAAWTATNSVALSQALHASRGAWCVVKSSSCTCGIRAVLAVVTTPASQSGLRVVFCVLYLCGCSCKLLKRRRRSLCG